MNKSIDFRGFSGLRSIDQMEVHAVEKILQKKCLYRGNTLVESSEVQDAEQNLKEFLGRKYVLMLNSGTSALQAALRALDLKRGDEVILSGYGWLTNLSCLNELGLTPVFVPVLNDLNIDTEKISKAITLKTKLILAVHAFGYPTQMENLLEIGNKNNIPVIDDVAQSLGSMWEDNQTGSKSTISFFSFQAFKIITSGEGGAVATDDKDLYLSMVRYHDAGLTRFSSTNLKLDSNEMPEKLGFNFRMSELSAAIFNSQFSKIGEIKSNLKVTKRNLIQCFEIPIIKNDFKIIEPVLNYGENYTTLLFEIYENGQGRKLCSYLRSNGVELNELGNDFYHTLPGWIKILEHNNCPFKVIEFENSLTKFRKLVSISVNIELSNQDLITLTKIINSFYDKNKD